MPGLEAIGTIVASKLSIYHQEKKCRWLCNAQISIIRSLGVQFTVQIFVI